MNKTVMDSEDDSVSALNPVPLWNLDSLYRGFSGADYAAELGYYTTVIDDMDTHLAEVPPQKTGVPLEQWLVRYFTLANSIDELESSLNAYAYCLYSTDTTNAAFLSEVSRLEGFRVRTKEQYVRFCHLISAADTDFQEPQNPGYAFLLRQAAADSKHAMTGAEENLAGEMERTGGAAWGRLHEQIISTLKDEATGKTFNEIRNDAYNADGNIRKAAWETERRLLKSAEIPLAACLNNLKGGTISLNKRRNWAEALDRSLHSARLSRKSLDTLIGVLEDSLPLWRKYLQAKGKLVSRRSDGCNFYDLFAPVGDTPPRAWTFAEAAAYVVEKYDAFSEEMGDFAQMAFEQHWVDAAVRPGKVGGAYCIDFPKQRQSRILCNFGGTFSDVLTLAHEMGHAYHHFCIKNADPLLQHYPMTLAETASIFAETIILEGMIENTRGEERLALVEQHLQDGCQVLVDILSRFYFEKSLFEERDGVYTTAELGAADFSRLMADAQEKSYGDGLAPDARHDLMWAVKSHYYSPDLDFYNFPYAFGQLFALSLYRRFRELGGSKKDRFPEQYARMLRKTGQGSCEEVCKTMGCDITAKAFWTRGLAAFTEHIAEFIASTEEKTP